jgi:hypothetical protein
MKVVNFQRVILMDLHLVHQMGSHWVMQKAMQKAMQKVML